MSKLVSGMQSLFDIALNAAKGVDQSVPEEVKSLRLDLCNSCDDLTITRQCANCLCFVDAKTGFRQEKCPKNKWLEYTTNETIGDN